MTATFKDFKKKFVIENNKEIPQATVELPSNRKKATLRAMKVKEQKEFLKALEKRDEFLINEAFDKILTSCVLTVNEQPFDGDALCVQDRMFLLIKIRQLSSGDKITIPHVIEVDGKEKTEQIEVDMTKFDVMYKEGDLNKEVMINSTTKILLGPSTRKNEKDLETWIKTKGISKESLVERRFAAYATLLKEIWFIPEESKTGEWEQVPVTFSDAVEFVTDACTEKDLKQIEEYAKELDFGIKLVVPVNKDGYNNPAEEVNLISFFIS